MGSPAFADERRVDRDAVHYRARAFGPDGLPLNLLVVNISPHGLMARCDAEFEIGTRLRIVFPAIGNVMAEVRWALGGRIGCQFDHVVDLAAYYEMLAAILKGR